MRFCLCCWRSLTRRYTFSAVACPHFLVRSFVRFLVCFFFHILSYSLSLSSSSSTSSSLPWSFSFITHNANIDVQRQRRRKSRTVSRRLWVESCSELLKFQSTDSLCLNWYFLYFLSIKLYLNDWKNIERWINRTSKEKPIELWCILLVPFSRDSVFISKERKE